MNKSNACYCVLLAGLLAAAGAQAQTAAAEVSEVPISSKDAISQDAHGQSGAATTSGVPPKAGEASTTVQGRPNADPNDPLVGKSRAEVRNEVMMRRAQLDAARAAQIMGNAGYGVAVGTPATAPEGTPSVFRGGTPQ